MTGKESRAARLHKILVSVMALRGRGAGVYTNLQSFRKERTRYVKRKGGSLVGREFVSEVAKAEDFSVLFHLHSTHGTASKNL